MTRFCINCRRQRSLKYSKLDYTYPKDRVNTEGHSEWTQTVECQVCGWSAKLIIVELTRGE